jgi:hypothetical protein
MSTKVFVTQDVPHLNLLPAKKFGELVVVNPAGNMTNDLERTVKRIKQKLDSFNRGDFILPVGDPLIIGLTMAIALRYAGGHIDVLRWDRQEFQYDTITIKDI